MKRLIFPAVLLLVLYLAVFGGEYSLWESRRAQADLAARRTDISRAQERLDSLRMWIDSLQYNDGSLERFARERYGFVRPGEYLYRIVEPHPINTGDENPER